VALLLTGCAHGVGGLAVLPATERPAARSVVDVDALMLDLSRMRALTGAGDALNIIPTMDGKSPVDIELLAKEVPAPCRFVFAETKTFGGQVADFHKTTYQYPPEGALISQGAAVYPDPQTARRAFDDLVASADACAYTSSGSLLVGTVESGADSLSTRPAATCGRDYQVKSVVLVEVTFCSYPESVSELVLTNLLRGVPG
jgi:PknH-like extracellular domain